MTTTDPSPTPATAPDPSAAADFAPVPAAQMAALTAIPRDAPAFRLLIATLNDDVFDGQVTYVDLPGLAGHVGVLNRHTPLLTLLADGPLTLYPVEGAPRTLPVMGGIAEVGPGGVTVLADFAGRSVDTEKHRMDAARERSATRHARQPRSEVTPGVLTDRARLDDELNLFLNRALRELRR
jgi:F-type H+-transporting ATPase subunit epsilon